MKTVNDELTATLKQELTDGQFKSIGEKAFQRFEIEYFEKGDPGNFDFKGCAEFIMDLVLDEMPQTGKVFFDAALQDALGNVDWEECANMIYGWHKNVRKYG